MHKRLDCQRQELVVIGNGMAGIRTVEELLAIDRSLYRIRVFGAEPRGNYNRVLLSPVLAGEKRVEDIMLNPPAWYEENGITLHAGDPAVRIDRRRRIVYARSGLEVPYDRLLVATGSLPAVPPVPGTDLRGVVTFRDLDDVERMLEAARRHRRAVVIGAGLLGLEAANGLHRRGMEVTVVHLTEVIMERQLDVTAAAMLRRELEARGLRFLLRASTEAIVGRRRVRAVRFADGSELPADLVVLATGIRPNIELARACGLYCERGIVVSDTMQTYDPRVYAVGECAQHRGRTYGLLAPIWEQTRVCATHLAMVGTGAYRGSEPWARLKVSEVDVFSAGAIEAEDGDEEVVLRDERRGVYRRLLLRDNRLRGVVLYGDTDDGAWYHELLRTGQDVSALRDRLVFGRAWCGAGTAAIGADPVASLPDEATICDCNGVRKAAFVAAIRTQGLKSREEVERATKAGSSCGSCRDRVAALVAAIAGADAVTDSPAEQPLCTCTSLSHAEVRAAIRERHLTSGADVRRELGWARPGGCHRCRPALNYYCLSTFPEEAVDDPQSRFINERAHANIQKDGTFSVVPRIWGGITNARELRAIADVVERYRIPTVKITGGQRIDLLGVRKEDLPRVWRELREQGGLVSGHAYGKALRTVKTCVGREWCRFGLQDSTALGIDLERTTWGTWTPHKVKMAVSGCPRNCAEASIKDFGVVCLDEGYELLVGGNGGVRLRGADVLCRVATPAEVIEHCCAFLQIYREEAWYLERTAHWIERVGIDYVRRRVAEDAASRREAAARFRHAQRHAQRDPWAERSADPARPPAEFLPLKEVV